MKLSQVKKKWLVVFASLFGISLITAGVFASTAITINGGSAVSLGAGSATVSVCGATATISAQQSFDTSLQYFKTTTVSVTGIAGSCAGKTLSLAFMAGGTLRSATWAVPSSGATNSDILNYGYGSAGATWRDAQTALSAFETGGTGTNLQTIALAAQ